jgi:4-diphosphocytidyl-2-C-methyl-D-erythritol kinase
MSVHRVLAPAKVNLGLFIGGRRPHDRRHELVTVMQSISLADQLTLEPAGGEGADGEPAGGERGGGEREIARRAGGAQEGGEDELVCPGVDGPPEENLALRALRAFRWSTGWDAPRQRLTIEKRIPLAAGLGGGSADAAAALRLARHASGLGDDALLLALAVELGADVPAQVNPGCLLATGAGERLRRLGDPGDEFALLVLPHDRGLSTAAVYEEADRLAIARTDSGLDAVRERLEGAWAGGVPAFDEGLVQNDLQQPAVLLCPDILDRLTRARASECDWTFLSGSGPTVLGLFTREGAAGAAGVAGGAGAAGAAGGAESPLARARAAAAALGGLSPAPVAAAPVDEAFARPWTEDEAGSAGSDGSAGSAPDSAVRHNLRQSQDEQD